MSPKLSLSKQIKNISAGSAITDSIVLIFDGYNNTLQRKKPSFALLVRYGYITIVPEYQ